MALDEEEHGRQARLPARAPECRLDPLHPRHLAPLLRPRWFRSSLWGGLQEVLRRHQLKEGHRGSTRLSARQVRFVLLFPGACRHTMR